MIKDSIKYLLYFINYLLSTNIHPPSESHKDNIPFYSEKEAEFPITYEMAQEKMREILSKCFAIKIKNHDSYKEDFINEFGEEDLEKSNKQKLLPYKTPPFLIKNVGLAKELFLYYKLISEDIGYVIPTLLYQRIFRGIHRLLMGNKVPNILTRVPDFIIIRGGRVRGIELGRETLF